MPEVELIVITFERKPDGITGNYVRRDTGEIVKQSDIETITDHLPIVTLSREEVYSGRKVTRDLPDGSRVNALIEHEHYPDSDTYDFFHCWLNENGEG